jgi:hypothetical protein
MASLVCRPTKATLLLHAVVVLALAVEELVTGAAVQRRRLILLLDIRLILQPSLTWKQNRIHRQTKIAVINEDSRLVGLSCVDSRAMGAAVYCQAAQMPMLQPCEMTLAEV